jgi:hypothetical protein
MTTSRMKTGAEKNSERCLCHIHVSINRQYPTHYWCNKTNITTNIWTDTNALVFFYRLSLFIVELTKRIKINLFNCCSHVNWCAFPKIHLTVNSFSLSVFFFSSLNCMFGPVKSIAVYTDSWGPTPWGAKTAAWVSVPYLRCHFGTTRVWVPKMP